MNLDWAQISAAVATAGAIYGGIRRSIRIANLALKKVIKDEVKSILEKVELVDGNQKSITLKIDHLVKAIKEYKAYSASTRSSLEDVQHEIKRAITSNTEAIKEMHKTRIEWLTKELRLIKGKDN